MQRRVLEASMNTEQPRRITQLRNPEKVSRKHNNPPGAWKKIAQ